MLDMYRTKKDQLQRIHNFAKLVQAGLRNLGYTGLLTRLLLSSNDGEVLLQCK